jgi:23S rRNA (cytidine1920-2'-O)/16S rRNA (cytidine1409-2'-O)-methyltransferase
VSRVARQRLDQLLVERGLAPTRSRAQALLLAGHVRVGAGASARTDRKAGDLFASDAAVELLEPDTYVSRGGHKLEAALDSFGVSPAGLVCLDVGASTGGFTHVLLSRGASRIFSIDVGRGQLADRLRRDPRVVSLERTNARFLTPELLGQHVELAVVDVSFISLALVLGPVAECFVEAGGPIVALVKPQFEAGRGQTDGGVVREPAIHRAVLERVARESGALGLALQGAIASPLLGPAGNREFFFQLTVPARGVNEAQVPRGLGPLPQPAHGPLPQAPREPLPLDQVWLSRFDELARP